MPHGAGGRRAGQKGMGWRGRDPGGRDLLSRSSRNPPEGFRRALRRQIPVQDGIVFDSIRVEKSLRQSPCSFLFSLFLLDDTTTRRTPHAFAMHPVLASRVIWIEEIAPIEWTAWRSFFEEFQRSAHAAVGGPVFCVPLIGLVAAARITIHSPSMRLHRCCKSNTASSICLCAPRDRLSCAPRCARGHQSLNLLRGIATMIVPTV
jgi:hypothetical protein